MGIKSGIEYGKEYGNVVDSFRAILTVIGVGVEYDQKGYMVCR